MLLGEYQNVNDFAEEDTLPEPVTSPTFIFLPNVVFVRIADPFAQILVESGDARLKFLCGNFPERGGLCVRKYVVLRVLCQRFRMVLNQLDKAVG